MLTTGVLHGVCECALTVVCSSIKSFSLISIDAHISSLLAQFSPGWVYFDSLPQMVVAVKFAADTAVSVVVAAAVIGSVHVVSGLLLVHCFPDFLLFSPTLF